MYVSEVDMYVCMHAIYSQMLQSSLLIHSNHPTQFVLVLDCCYTVEVMENLPLQYSGRRKVTNIVQLFQQLYLVPTNLPGTTVYTCKESNHAGNMKQSTEKSITVIVEGTVQ